MNGEQGWPKDPDLVDLYSNLEVETAPPPPLEAVAARITQRRRRRRGAAVAGSAAVAVAAASAAVGAGLGGQDSDVIAGPPENMLTVTRPDGSTFAFTDFTITCEVEEGREVIVVTSGPRTTGESLESPILHFSIPVENGAGATRTHDLPPELEPVEGFDPLPGMETPGNPPFMLFVATEEGPDGENNEVDSSEQGAAGTFEVGGAACGDDPSIDFKVDGTLGSEVDQPPLDIVGEVHLG